MVSASFEIVPAGPRERFVPFVLDVPMVNGYEPARDRAARRAYFSAMAHLAGADIDVDEFEVYEFDGDKRGRKVGPGGFEV